MKQTPIKKKSSRQLSLKYGRVICEFCGLPPWGNELGGLDAHHINKNRRDNTTGNCYICHRICHSTIHNERITVKQLGFEGLKRGVDRP